MPASSSPFAPPPAAPSPLVSFGDSVAAACVPLWQAAQPTLRILPLWLKPRGVCASLPTPASPAALYKDPNFPMTNGRVHHLDVKHGEGAC